MIVESCQMLANCYSQSELETAPKTKKGTVRKHSYFNNPCSIWTRKSLSNFNWLLIHALEMVQEKMYRNGKHHFCDSFLHWCKDKEPNLKDIGFTFPAQAMPDIYRSPDPVKAYRDYYKFYKMKNISMKWTKREKPYWI